MSVIETNMIPDGLASAPGLALSSEPTTGLFKKAAGKLGLAVGGAEVGEINANGLAGGVQVKRATFQAQGAATHTATIPIPAGATIIDIQVQGIALWTAATSASLKVGNDTDDDFWYVATDLKATDLLAGESNTFEHPGGKAGIGIASEQRVFKVATANNVIGVVTQVGTSNTGTTDLVVIYAVPVSITPVIS